MLLDLNKDFYYGLTPVSRIDSGTVSFREVYKGRDSCLLYTSDAADE